MWRRRKRYSAVRLTGDGRGAPVWAELAPGVELMSDLAPARWVEERVLPWIPGGGALVGSVLPAGFDAYVRLDHAPDEPDDDLAPDDVAALLEVLARHTAGVDPLWVCVWEGYGGSPRHFDDAPKVRIPAREHLLLRAPAEALTRRLVAGPLGLHAFGPSLWWPGDRAWCAGSDIDLPWTYVGGSAACVADVRERFPRAIPVSPDEPVVQAP